MTHPVDAIYVDTYRNGGAMMRITCSRCGHTKVGPIDEVGTVEQRRRLLEELNEEECR